MVLFSLVICVMTGYDRLWQVYVFQVKNLWKYVGIFRTTQRVAFSSLKTHVHRCCQWNRYLFLPLLTLWYSIWLAFRPENCIWVSNLSFSCSCGGEKIKFRETAIIFKSIICERLSEVKSTLSGVVSFQSFHLFRLGRFVSFCCFGSWYMPKL